jgi:hypothetical protein
LIRSVTTLGEEAPLDEPSDEFRRRIARQPEELGDVLHGDLALLSDELEHAYSLVAELYRVDRVAAVVDCGEEARDLVYLRRRPVCSHGTIMSYETTQSSGQPLRGRSPRRASRLLRHLEVG